MKTLRFTDGSTLTGPKMQVRRQGSELQICFYFTHTGGISELYALAMADNTKLETKFTGQLWRLNECFTEEDK